MYRAKALRILVLGFAVFVLYLGWANFLYFLGIVSLPLGAAINDFVVPLVVIDVGIVNLLVVYSRRHAAGTK